MKRKQHLQSFLSVCNKRLLSATARHAGKRPSEQFAVSLLQEETSEFYSRPCFVIFKLNLLPKLKKLRARSITWNRSWISFVFVGIHINIVKHLLKCYFKHGFIIPVAAKRHT